MDKIHKYKPCFESNSLWNCERCKYSDYRCIEQLILVFKMGEESTYFFDLLLYIIRYIVAFQLLKVQRLSLSPFLICQVPFKSFVLFLLSIYPCIYV